MARGMLASMADEMAGGKFGRVPGSKYGMAPGTKYKGFGLGEHLAGTGKQMSRIPRMMGTSPMVGQPTPRPTTPHDDGKGHDPYGQV